MKILGFAIGLLTTLSITVSATVRYVDVNSTNATPPYTNWATAATNIQVAVDVAVAKDVIMVTNGIFQTGGRIVSGDSTSNRLAVTKEVTIRSVNGPSATIIRGYQVPGATNGAGAVRCVYLGTNASLMGFTLANGATRTNSGSSTGGGVKCQSVSAVLSNCVIVGNAAVFGAGASSGTLFNCVLSNNIAENSGGGGYNGTYNNCLFVNNAAASGGAVAATTAGTARLNNCTVFNNSASSSGGGLSSRGLAAPAYLVASNCIVFGNSASNGSNYTDSFASDMMLNYCCTTPLPAAGTGNFAIDPLLADPSNGNYRLQSNSPCINAGSTAVASALDLDGNPRLVGPAVDMGAYEHQSLAPLPLFPSIQVTHTGVSTGVFVVFTGQVAGHATATRWVFGDGTVVSNQLSGVSHSWSSAGDYVVTLWAYNNSFPNGVSAAVTIHVLVNPVHYVSQQSTNSVAPYSSWNTAATCIQDAVDAAYIRGTVLVSNGVYATGGREVSSSNGYTLTNRVAVMKQITVRSLNGPAVTTIQGYQLPATTNGTSAVRCVYLTNNTALIGFTLTGGATVIYPGSGMDYERVQSGGGVYSESSSAIVSNCILIANAAYYGGGGAYSGTLMNCRLVGNSASWGGGTLSSILKHSALIGNSAVSGGGIASSTAYNCTFIGNTGVYHGGGADYGTLSGCTVVGNSAADIGGGTYGSTVQNCIVSGNTATSEPNCSLGAFGDGSLDYSCTIPLSISGNGNITNDPRFLDVAAGNLRLQSNSPCINAGSLTFGALLLDSDGRPRIVGGTVDMGAYEYQGPGMGEFTAWLEQYDLPTDGSADYADNDTDLHNNWREWKADTNPTNSQSVLRMLTPSNSPSGYLVQWQSTNTRTYFLERANNLGSQPPFSNVASNIVGQAGTTTYTDTSATNGGPFFYRVGVQE